MALVPLVRIALLITLAFTLLIGLSHLQPYDNSALSALTDCAAPCWQGLKIGVTSGIAALAQLDGAEGVERSQAQCFLSDDCMMYRWTYTENQAIYALLEVDHKVITLVSVTSPGFTVGDALLALRDLALNGGDFEFGVANQYHIDLYFADSHLVLRTVTRCPGTFHDLLDSPVRTLELEASNRNVPSPRPALTFSALHRTFNRTCGRLE